MPPIVLWVIRLGGKKNCMEKYCRVPPRVRHASTGTNRYPTVASQGFTLGAPATSRGMMPLARWRPPTDVWKFGWKFTLPHFFWRATASNASPSRPFESCYPVSYASAGIRFFGRYNEIIDCGLVIDLVLAGPEIRTMTKINGRCPYLLRLCLWVRIEYIHLPCTTVYCHLLPNRMK